MGNISEYNNISTKNLLSILGINTIKLPLDIASYLTIYKEL